MNFKFKEKYNGARDLINFKTSLIQEDVVPFFMVDFSPDIKNSIWNVSGTSTHLQNNKSYNKYKYSTLMKYITTFNSNYNTAKSKLDQFCSIKIFNSYYYNSSSITKGQLIELFNNGASHGFKDILTFFSIGTDKYYITQGLLAGIKIINNTRKIGNSLIMLMVKKDYIPIMKLQMLLGKPILFEYFEIWISDEILLFSDTNKKMFKTYLFDKFNENITIKWKSNMSNLTQGYKTPLLETLDDKKEWLINKELELRNKLYGETNTLKTYTINFNNEVIIDSNHPELKPKPKKFIVELID